jgi:(p)ppGpp synthase/HD superfamily hydrolase
VSAEGASFGDSEALARAFELASGAHHGQQRRDGSPYIAHPLAVCELLASRGASESMLVAALLHDSVENSSTTIGEVSEAFGVEVGELVAALTEDEGIDDWVERKNALRAQVGEEGPAAAAIYAADKLTNLRETRAIYATHGEATTDLHKAPTLDLRVAAWRADLEFVRTLVDAELAGELAAELERFARQRMHEGATAQEAGARG